MKAPPFSYLRPTVLEDAIEALARHGEAAVPLAGGQSLVPMMNFRVATPEILVDLNRIAALAGVRDRGDAIEIGAMTRHRDVAADPLVHRYLPLLPLALAHVAHVGVRNRGTLGGSLALADPAAEMPACAVAMDAQILLHGPDGERWVAAEDFFLGVYETALRAGELLVAVRWPKQPVGTRVAFGELARRHGDFAHAGVAGIASESGGLRLAFLGVNTRPVLVTDPGADLDGLLDPMDDPTAPAAYRRRLAGVLMRRILPRLLEAA